MAVMKANRVSFSGIEVPESGIASAAVVNSKPWDRR